MSIASQTVGMLGHDPARDTANTAHDYINPFTCDDLATLVGLVNTSAYSPVFDMNADGVLNATDINRLTQLVQVSTPATYAGPPEGVNIDPLGDDNQWQPPLTSVGSGVAWYAFTAPDVSVANRAFLDFDTEGSTVSNTALAVFDSAGNLVASDTSDGTGNLAQLTFGFSAGRPGPGGDALAYNGRDGGSSTLTTGLTYYVAVVVEPDSSTATFGHPWGVRIPGVCTTQPSGIVSLRYRNGWWPVPSAPTPRTDLGKVHSASGYSPKATGDLDITSTPTVVRYRWVHFRSVLPTNASDYYLDIHTIGSNLPDLGRGAHDTEMAIFNKSGDKIAENDDYTDGSTTIRQSVLSWGQTSSARSYGSGAATGISGGNGAVLPAGDYYVAIGQRDLSFDQDFAVTGINTNNGTVKLTVVTNIVNPACNDADVAGLGGSPGPDGILTVDDIVYFNAQFFASNLDVADLVGLGGAPSPPDGQITADDLVYFLAVFFSACAP